MRLHALELAAIGPYATRQRVDFEALAASGLFLLEGPTGAGKSTILDAITFALYGQAGTDPGSLHADKLRSHFAAPDAEPSVTLELSLRGTRYRIRRTPRWERPKRRGGGTVTQNPHVHLERRDGAGWSTVSASLSEAATVIEDAVGLDRAQFTQVMVLQQGEFARFLRASSDDRQELLTRLFGTQLYDAITAELERRRTDATRAREAARQHIASAVAAAVEAAGLDAADRAELAALPRDGRAARLAGVAQDLAARLARAREDLAAGAAVLSGAQQRADQAECRADRLRQLARARARLAAHEAGRAAHDARAARLDAARQADPVRPLLAALDDALAALSGARAEAAVLPVPDLARLNCPGAEPGLAALIPAMREQPAGERVAVPALASAADSGPGLLTTDPGEPDDDPLGGLGCTAAAARAATAGAQAAERTAAALEHLAGVEAGLDGRTAGLDGLSAAAREAAEQVQRLEADRQRLPGLIADLDERLTGARIAAAGLADAQGQLAGLGARLAAATRAAGLADELAELADVAAEAVDAHQAAVDTYQEAVQRRLDNMAAELACQLSADCACPVCGSTGHPAPAPMPDGAVSAADVAAAQERRDAVAQVREEAAAARDAVAAEHAASLAEAGGATAEELEDDLAELAGRATAAEEAAQEAAELEPELADRRAELAKLGDDLTAAATAAAAARAAADDAAARLDAARGEVAGAAAGFASVSARQDALREAAAAARAQAGALDEVRAARKAADAARRRADRELSRRGFTGIEAAAAAALDPGDLAVLAGEVTDWTAGLAARAAAVREAAEQAGPVTPDGSPDGGVPGDALADEELAAAVAAAGDTAAAAAAALAAAADADAAARGDCQALSGQADRLTQRLADLDRADDAADRLAERTGPVVRLAGLAKGTEGQRKTALTTYVLRLWFEQVVQAANVRLAAMSAGRYELARTDEAESRRGRAGLTLAVTDRHTGAQRSPRSLSGGETFYTSLALALGLADVVKAEAGGVELDTLFIDEGFGTLDAATLDQVMSVIDDLRDRGRAVGIVSHVADLKDRVYERLEVRRLPSGPSALTVVA